MPRRRPNKIRLDMARAPKLGRKRRLELEAKRPLTPLQLHGLPRRRMR
jgi:hypothetical protein